MKNKKTSIFLWEGINANGMKIKGECEAENAPSARMHLKNERITLLKIKTKPASLFSSWKNKITSQHIIAFTKELSTLITANIPLLTSLEISEKNSKNISLKKMIFTIRQSLASGESFSQALKSFPDYFNKTFLSLIKAGESSGTFSIMLNRITIHHEKSEKLKHTIKKALFYPITVLTVSFIVTIAMLIFIVPQFASLFQNFGAELPLLTQFVLKISDIMFHHGIFILMFFSIITAFIYFYSKKSMTLKIYLDKTILRIPLFGRILKFSILAQSFSTLSVLLRAGIPALEAMQLIEQISTNTFYQQAFFDISQKITIGNSIQQSIAETGKFPESVIQMITIGEASGTLDNMLENLAHSFQSQVDDITHNLSLLLEPAIMIFLCAVVGTVIIAMYLPIFKLGTVI